MPKTHSFLQGRCFPTSQQLRKLVYNLHTVMKVRSPSDGSRNQSQCAATFLDTFWIQKHSRIKISSQISEIQDRLV